MTTATPPTLLDTPHVSLDAKLAKGPGNWMFIPFAVVLAIGLSYAGMQLFEDLAASTDPRADLQRFLRTRKLDATTVPATRALVQIETVRNLLLAWVLTLPASMLLAGSLFWLFSRFG